MKRTKTKPQMFLSRAERRIANGLRNGSPRRGYDGRVKGSNSHAQGGLRIAGGGSIDWGTHAENLRQRQLLRKVNAERKALKKAGKEY